MNAPGNFFAKKAIFVFDRTRGKWQLALQNRYRKPKEDMLLHRIKESRADAAIVAAAKMCEPGLDEQVAYSKELDEHEIPYFISEFEENQTTFDHLAIQLETFVENILFD